MTSPDRKFPGASAAVFNLRQGATFDVNGAGNPVTIFTAGTTMARVRTGALVGNGTVTNSERRITRVNAALRKPGMALHDWEIAAAFGRQLAPRARRVFRAEELAGLRVLLADDGQMMIDMSTEASLQMNDAPSAGAQSLVSLWQTGGVGVKLDRWINWSKRRSAAVQYIEQAQRWGS